MADAEPSGRTVSIRDQGRCGEVVYHDPRGELRGYWEFGGGDVVATVAMGTGDDWRRDSAWAVPERAAILQFIAGEVVRQRAPRCVAEVDAPAGYILLRQAGPGPAPAAVARAAPACPGEDAEPLLVMLDNATGTHSPWQ